MSVPCGVAVLCFKKIAGREFVLMGKRKGAHGAGEYSFPCGRVEPWERLEACAARELKEETGLDFGLDCFKLWNHCPVTNTITGGEPWVTLYYFTHAYEGDPEPKVMEPDKCEEWDYYSVRNLPKPLFKAAEECFIRAGILVTETCKNSWHA